MTPLGPRVFAGPLSFTKFPTRWLTEPVSMRNHPLGRTGLFVSELCLGTMTFGGTDGIWGKIGDLGQADAERLVGQAIDAGINFIDTADVYAAGRLGAAHRPGAEEPQDPARERRRRHQGVRRDRRRARTAAATRAATSWTASRPA